MFRSSFFVNFASEKLQSLSSYARPHVGDAVPDIQDGGREQKAATSHVLLVRGLLSRCTNLLT